MERERVSAREKERKREEGRRFWVSICSLKSVESVKKWSDICPRDQRKQKVCLQIQNGQREWMFFRWRSVTSTNKALNFVVIFCQKIWQRSCLFVSLLTDIYKDTNTHTHTRTHTHTHTLWLTLKARRREIFVDQFWHASFTLLAMCI